MTRQDVTCPSNPFNGKAPVPAWNPNAATEGSGTGDNSGTGGSGTGSQPDTDGAPGEIGTQPPMSSGKIAGIVIGSVAGAVVAAGIVLLALGLKGKNVLPRLSPRKRQMEPETPGSALGEGGRYHEMRDGEVVVPAGAAPDNYSQLELYSLEAAEDH